MRKVSLILSVIVSVVWVQSVVAGSREDAFLKGLQAELHRRGDPWVAGTTSVSHLSLEEKKELCSLPLVSRAPKHPERQRLSRKPKNPPPVEMDWRDYQGHNWMTPVTRQLCGDCWVFAWCGAHEARMKVFRDEPTGTYNLSEQFVVSCSPQPYGYSGGTDYIGDWVKRCGIPDERCFPYSGQDLPCDERCADWKERIEAIGGKITDWGETSVSTDSVKCEVMNGPTAFAVNWKEGKNEGIREDFFYYKSGVYEPVVGKWMKSGHAVCLCGWDSSGKWLVKNSWGTQWGDKGYAYIGNTIWWNVWMNPLRSLAGIVLEHIWTSERKWSPGEQVDIVVTLKSEEMDAANVKAALSMTDSHVTIDVGDGDFGNIFSGTVASNLSTPFKATASISGFISRSVQCSLHVSEDSGYSTVLPFSLWLGWTLCDVIDSFDLPPTPGDTCLAYGMACDGTNLYMTDWYSPYIYKLDRDGNFLGTIPAPENAIHATGIDYDRGNDCLWVTNSTTKMIYKVNPSNGSVISAFQSPATQYPAGLAFDGVDLWVADRDANTIYRVATDGSVLGSFVIPMRSNDRVRGLAFDSSMVPWHEESTLILFVTHWDSTFTHLDSCAIHEMKRDGTLITKHRCITPGNTDANGRVVCVDPEYSDYWVDGGANGPIYKIRGFYSRSSVEEQSACPRVSNLAVTPNPTRQGACISFYMPAAGRIEINVYDMAGKRISCLADREFQGGRHEVSWRGTGTDGEKLPSGVYFCRVKTGQSKSTRKLVLLR